MEWSPRPRQIDSSSQNVGSEKERKFCEKDEKITDMLLKMLVLIEKWCYLPFRLEMYYSSGLWIAFFDGSLGVETRARVGNDLSILHGCRLR